MVVSGREEMSATPSKEALRQLQLRYRLAAMTADAYHEAGFSVVLQDIAIGSLLTEYVGLIRSRPLVLVVLAPRADVVASRESARSKSAYQAGAPEAPDWDSALRRETPKIGMWIDSSEQEAPETVQAIIDQAPELGQIK